VLLISPFGYGHDPDGADAPRTAEVTGAGLLELPLVQATISTLTDVSAVIWARKNLFLIRLTPSYYDIIMIDL
jgi:hypothetical protein